jgi:hypothetical protein
VGGRADVVAATPHPPPVIASLSLWVFFSSVLPSCPIFVCGVALLLPFVAPHIPLCVVRMRTGVLRATGFLLIVFASQITGYTIAMVLFVTCLLTVSLLMDHYGWLGSPVRYFNWFKVFGVLLLLGGMVHAPAPAPAPASAFAPPSHSDPPPPPPSTQFLHTPTHRHTHDRTCLFVCLFD